MANCQLPPPDAIICTCTGNSAANWRVFLMTSPPLLNYSLAWPDRFFFPPTITQKRKKKRSGHVRLTDLNKKDAAIQAATLKTLMGKECRQIMSRLDLNDTDKKKPDKIIEKLLVRRVFRPSTERSLREIFAPLCSTTTEQNCGSVYHPPSPPSQ